jgi:hypothetical protein
MMIASSPGLWLVVLSDGALEEQPLVGWDLSDVDVGVGPIPIAAGFGMPGDGEQWALRFLDGTYWVPDAGVRTSSKEEVATLLGRREAA